MRVHVDGGGPYACNLCRASFAEAGGLASNLRKAHETPSACDE